MKHFMNSRIIQQDMEDIYNREIDYSKLYNSTVLVTGATGMLASYLVYFLIYLNEKYDAKIKIISLVRNCEKYKSTYYEYVEKDYMKVLLYNGNDMPNITYEIDYIIHAASMASPEYYAVKPVEVILPNTVSTYMLLELARKKSCKGFLFFSTGDIYGEINDLKGDTIKEDTLGIVDPLNIHSCYNESKRLGETLCKAYSVEYEIPTKIARIWHTYAPTMNLEKDPRVFSSFVKCVMEGKDIVMYSDGSSKRAFCYITDAVSAYLAVLLYGKKGEAYNVCNTEMFISIYELGKMLCEINTEKKLSVVRRFREDNDTYLENTITKWLPPDNEKVKKLGCRFLVNLWEGFRRVIEHKQIVCQNK